MKAVVKFVTALAVFGCHIVNAYTYREKVPEAVQSIETHGVGTIYTVQRPDGNYQRIRIDGYRRHADGSLSVDYSFPDKVVIVDFNDREVTFEPTSEEIPEEVLTSEDVAGGVSLGAGVAEGVMAGLQYALVTDSKVARDLEKIYARIDKIYAEISAIWGQVDSVKVNLENDIISLETRANLEDSKDLENALNKMSARAGFSMATFSNKFNVESGLKDYKWLSTDSDFVHKASGIRETLGKVRPRTAVDRTMLQIAGSSLVHADRASYLGDKEQSDYLLDISKAAADVLVGIDPITGFGRSLYETITGKNLITGTELSGSERTLAVLGVVTAGYAVGAFKAFKYLMPIAKKIAPATLKTLSAAKNFLTKTGQGFELVGEGSTVRKINLRSAREAEWGLKPRHLNKHFFGNSEFALKNIDRAGNTDQWMQNIADLAQRPVTSITPNGMLDIYHRYSKADGSGFYKLGIRLAPSEGNSFDLVTVLTDQKRGPKLW